MKQIMFAALLCLLVGCQSAPPLSKRERAFFPTGIAYQESDSADWRILVDGAITRKSWAVSRLPLFEDWFDLEEMIPDEQKRLTFRERIIPFMCHHPGGRSLNIVIGNRMVRVGPSDDHGYIRNEFRFPADALSDSVKAGQIELRVPASNDDPSHVSSIQVFSGPGVSVISDIDDTIRITQVQNTKKMIVNTFMEPFRPVPGMQEVMRNWQRKPGVQFHYLTASTYWLYPPMTEFLKDYYP